MMLQEDPEAQQAIKEALAQLAGEGAQSPDTSTMRPPPSPGFDDAGSYMTPSDIANQPVSLGGEPQAQGDIITTPMRADMGLGTSSDVTDAARREQVASSEDKGGFDWGRAFFAAGGGDIAAFDKGRANREQAPYDRANALQAQFDSDKQRTLVRDAMDPQSQLSKQRQQEYADQMAMRAQMHEQSGQRDLAGFFAEQAKRASTMSATQIDRASQQMGGLFKENLEARKAAAQEELGRQGQQYHNDMLKATTGNQQAGRAIERENLNIKKKELDLKHEERQDAQNDKKNAREEKKNDLLPSAAQADEHVDATETIKLLRRAKELLPKVSYIGTGAKTANTVLGGLPDALDIRTPEDKEFASIVQRIAAPERHKLFGSALSKGEDIVSQELLPGISKNKPTLKQVLDLMETNVANRVKKASTLYPGLKKLESLDASQLSDRDQQALEWANAHPDDERAAKIRQKLGVK